MVNEEAALLDRRVTQVTPAALFNRRLHGQRGAGLAVAQGVLAHPFNRSVKGVMFSHPADGLPEGDFGSEIRQHTL
jgi:hypothetical protein